MHTYVYVYVYIYAYVGTYLCQGLCTEKRCNHNSYIQKKYKNKIVRGDPLTMECADLFCKDLRTSAGISRGVDGAHVARVEQPEMMICAWMCAFAACTDMSSVR